MMEFIVAPGQVWLNVESVSEDTAACSYWQISTIAGYSATLDAIAYHDETIFRLVEENLCFTCGLSLAGAPGCGCEKGKFQKVVSPQRVLDTSVLLKNSAYWKLVRASITSPFFVGCTDGCLRRHSGNKQGTFHSLACRGPSSGAINVKPSCSVKDTTEGISPMLLEKLQAMSPVQRHALRNSWSLCSAEEQEIRIRQASDLLHLANKVREDTRSSDTGPVEFIRKVTQLAHFVMQGNVAELHQQQSALHESSMQNDPMCYWALKLRQELASILQETYANAEERKRAVKT